MVFERFSSMKNLEYLSLSIFFMISFSACSSLIVSSVITNNQPIFKSNEDVLVILSKNIPAYDEVGYIQVVVPGVYSDDIGYIINKARAKAQKMGANCLILTSLRDLNDNGETVIYTRVPHDIPSSDYKYPHKYIFIAGVLN
jgi:hypothetical protein